MTSKPIWIAGSLSAIATLLLSTGPAASGAPAPLPPGALTIIDRDGHAGAICPLKHTDVQAEITGFLARVNVTQEFENPSGQKVEAVYTFPLPNKAAVDDLTMYVGDRTVKGAIKPREEARRIFEQARNQGQVASLLDQERPNIFTQSVTNIGPGMKVKIVISYVETLPYEAGNYEFSFPMVVGPRYMPRSGVPDSHRISPPVTPPATRAGHDLSLKVSLDAGVPLESIGSKTHEVDITRPNGRRAEIQLRNQATIPNRDFILKYDVAGGRIEDALLTHRDKRGGYFTFILQPPDRVLPNEITPKELVFVMDTSGSMQGFPIEKSKELIKLSLDTLNPRDTFNLITFSGDTHILFPAPVPATPENIATAQRFVLSRSGSGGTEMMKAIRAALDPSDRQDHLRVVCFLTDGYVGNDMEIIGEVKRHSNARVFSFGIGNSVNRFLLDKMAEEGRGEVEYLTLNEDGSQAAARFAARMRTPLLTDITVDWAGLPVTDVYPQRVPDLFSAKPMVLTGRYSAAAQGTIHLRGKVNGQWMQRDLKVTLPADEPAREVLATLWARTKVEHLMSQDWEGMQNGSPRGDLKTEITRLGIDYRMMTQFTSFVAVEEKTIVEGGRPRRVEVPVEMPHGVSYEGVFGLDINRQQGQQGKFLSITGGIAMNRAQAPTGIVGGAPPMSMPKPLPTAPPPPARESPRREADMLTDEVRQVSAKLDPQLLSLLQAVQAQRSTAAFGFFSNGKAQVKIWLLDDSASTLDQLKKLGVEVTAHKAGKQLLARVSAGTLAQIANLQSVLFVSPDLGQPE